MNARKMSLAGVLFFLVALALSAQQTWNTTVYFDYTYNVTYNGYLTSRQKDLNNQFYFRRAYITHENKVADTLSFRFRFDADYVKAVDSSAKKDDKLRPFMKHLYVQYTGLIPKSTLKIGMADTITFSLEEGRWNYRSVAKTLVDGYKDITGKEINASSADVGISLVGSIAKEIRYGFMVTNGAGYSHPEGDKYKKLMGQIHFVPVSGLSFVGYADYEKKTKTDRARTYKLDSYFEMVQGLVLAGEWFVYDNSLYKTSDLTHYNVSGFSVFGRMVAVQDKLNLFARYDHYDPNSKISKDETNLIIAGVDYAPIHSSFKLQPNIWYYTYSDSDRKDDVVFNFTFFLSF